MATIAERLIKELAGEGGRIGLYAEGGIHIENVVSALVLQGLDFLPRSEFLGAIVANAVGGSSDAKYLFRSQAEKASILFQPNFGFRVNKHNHHRETVTPDALIETDDVFLVVEAKRAKQSQFKEEQLARQYVTTIREAKQKDKKPLLVLMIGQGPEVKVEKATGKRHFKQDIREKLPAVLQKVDSAYDQDTISEMIDDIVAWTTWADVLRTVENQLDMFDKTASGYGTIERLANFTMDVIQRHLGQVK